MALEFTQEEEQDSPTGEVEEPAVSEVEEEGAEDLEESPTSEEDDEAGEEEEAEEEDEGDIPDPVDEPKLTPYQKRINKLTASFRDQERRTQALEAELERERALRAQQAATEIPAEKPRPQEGDFEDYSEYVRAENDWSREQRARDEAVARQQQRSVAERVSFQSMVHQLSAPSKAIHPDWDQVVSRADVNLTENIVRAASRMNGTTGEILYQLAQNPEECNRISRLHPTDIVFEVQAIHNRLASRPPPKGIKATPNPAKPVGQRESFKGKSEAEMTDEEHFRFLRQRRYKAAGIPVPK